MKRIIGLSIALFFALVLNAQNSELDSLISEIQVLLEAEELNKALPLIDKALELDNENSSLYCAKASILTDQGRETEAITNYEKAIEVKDNYDAYYNLHVIYFNRAVEKYNLFNEESNQLKSEKLASEVEGNVLKAIAYIYDNPENRAERMKPLNDLLNYVRTFYQDDKISKKQFFEERIFNSYSYTGNSVLLHAEFDTYKSQELSHFFSLVTDPQKQDFKTEFKTSLHAIHLDLYFRTATRIKFYKGGLCVGEADIRTTFYSSDEFDHSFDPIYIDNSLTDGNTITYVLYNNKKLIETRVVPVFSEVLRLKYTQLTSADTDGDGYGDADKGRAMLKQEIAKTPNNPDIYLNAVSALKFSGEGGVFVQRFLDEGLKVAPNNYYLLAKRGEYSFSQVYQDGIYEEIVNGEIEKNNLPWVYEHFSTALSYYKRALKVSPNDAYAAHFVAYIEGIMSLNNEIKRLKALEIQRKSCYYLMPSLKNVKQSEVDKVNQMIDKYFECYHKEKKRLLALADELSIHNYDETIRSMEAIVMKLIAEGDAEYKRANKYINESSD